MMGFLYTPFPQPRLEWEGEDFGEEFPHEATRTRGDYCPCGAQCVSLAEPHPACDRCETWMCPHCEMWCTWNIGCSLDDGLDELCDDCWSVISDEAA